MASIAVAAAFCLITGMGGLAYLRALHAIVPLRPGRYEMEDFQCFLWKHHAVIRDVSERLLSPFFPVFLRGPFFMLLGAGMGQGATVAAHGIMADPLLTKMGDRAVVGEHACLTAHCVTDNRLIIDSIVIGPGATVGINAVVNPGVTVGEGAVIAAGAVVPPGTEIPAHELWGGVPAKRIKCLRRLAGAGQAADDIPVLGAGPADRLEAA